MANIYVVHHADDVADAERLARAWRFLEFEVVLCNQRLMARDDLPFEEFGDTDTMFVLWTPSARLSSWVTSQCVNVNDPSQMVVGVTKAAAEFALPLMVHQSCIVHLENPARRVSSDAFAHLVSEIGQRCARPGLKDCVSALAETSKNDRDIALASWAAANPGDPFAEIAENAIENGTTRNLQSQLSDLLRKSKPQSLQSSTKARGSERSRSRSRSRASSNRLAYAAIGVLAVGLVGGILSNVIGENLIAQADNKSPSEHLGQRQGEVILASLEASSAVQTEAVINDGMISPEADAMPVEAAILSVTIPENTSGSAMLNASLEIAENFTLLAEEYGSESESAELQNEPVLIDDPSDELEVFFDATEQEILAEGDADLEEAELLLPYIPGTQNPGDAFTDRLADDTGAPEMVVIAPGAFLMGSPMTERGRDLGEGPQKTIEISDAFAVGKYEVSVAEFSKFVEATGYDAGDTCMTYRESNWDWRAGRSFEVPGFNQSARHPVTCVSWAGATAYAEWLSEQTGASYRLLTEAEWEYAARSGSQTAYAFGNSADEGCGHMNGADISSGDAKDTSLAMDCKDGVVYAAPTGSYAPNLFGLYDMHGNVWEWTADAWNSSISGVPENGAARGSGETNERVVRGGSWFSLEFWLRSASRNKFEPGDRRNDVGFRVARDL